MENQSLLNNPQQMVLRGKGQEGGTLEEHFQANFLRFEPQGWKAQALNGGAEMRGVGSAGVHWEQNQRAGAQQPGSSDAGA